MDNKILKQMHKSLMGSDLIELNNVEEVIRLLGKKNQNIIMDLKWGEKKGQEYHERHKIVLSKINDEKRVVFYNPLGYGKSKNIGEIVGNTNNEPKRKIEGTNMESVSLDEFRDFFTDRDAVCFMALK